MMMMMLYIDKIALKVAAVQKVIVSKKILEILDILINSFNSM